MELVKEMSDEREHFSDVIKLLIEKRMLKKYWTGDDLSEALACLSKRVEIAEMFGLVENDNALEESLFRRHLVACHAATKKKEAWRQNPVNLERERSQDKARRSKKKKKRDAERHSARLAYLGSLKQQARAARKALIARETPPPPPPVPAGASQWKKLANVRRPKAKSTISNLGISATA